MLAHADARVAALEAQLQALQQAANSADEAVNARGALLIDRLQDIPNRVREVATHGVRQGAATALSIAQVRFGHELRYLQPGFPGEDDPADYDELINDFEGAAEAVGNIVDEDGAVNNVFFGR
ncbi:hypothetical protein PAHAL_9G214200 [Panicum hallii]|uniref:Uncharacterized protein n=1 Tax=Panicum hallii TaxID=206008 RepID=A0A2T8I1Z7_9POAL|nr:uncharacterized protein LOC112872820 [Panicum hallii]PVH31695.1 hypothetical protein PAHAL_9G214200 [Panicum hallii]